MRLHRFIGDFDLSKNRLKIFDKQILDKIRKVLRLQIGDKMILCRGDNNEAIVEISNFGKGVVEVEVIERMQNQNESRVKVTLYCSILKRTNFELVVQKATEVGVREIVPMICKRTVKLKIKSERLGKIIKESAEQSGRGALPKLCEVIRFEEAVKHARDNEVNLFFDIQGELFKVNDKEMRQIDGIGIFIGPEGGWDKREREMARASDLQTVSLGKLTFRSETAAIIASYIATSLRGKLTIQA